MKFKGCLAVLLCTALLSTPVCAAGSFTVRYEMDRLSWQGVHEAEFVKLIIAPRGVDVTELAEEDLNRRNDILIVAEETDESGSFSGTDIELPAFPNGTYIASAGSLQCSDRRIFVKSDAAVLAQVAGAFLSSDNRYQLLQSHLDALGFDPAVFSQYGNEIVALLSYYIQHNTQGLSFDQLYLLSEQVVLMQKGKLSVADMLMLCYDFTGIDYQNDYQSYPAEVLTALEQTAPAQRYTDTSFAAAYREALVLAQANALGREMAEAVIGYFTDKNVDLSQYNLLSDYEKSSVFGRMEASAPFTSVSLLQTAFQTAVQQQLAARNAGNSPGSSAGGGSGGGSKPAYSVQTDAAQQGQQAGFSDVQGHWAKSDINTMANKGVINGFADGSFRPEANVTRAEFVKMLAGLLGLSPTGADRQFSDVAPDAWFYPYVSAAVGYGLIQGVTTGEFAPDAYVTREDAAVILHRLFVKQNAALTYSGMAFADDDVTADYAKEAVSLLASNGVIQGADGLFMPKRCLSRAEAAALLCRTLDYLH